MRISDWSSDVCSSDLLDDVALPFGSVRLRPKGGDAGHNGLKHINLQLGSNAYPRLRFGIGDNYFRGQQVNYVLSGFDDDELMELPALIARSADMIESVVTTGIELTMTQFNKQCHDEYVQDSFILLLYIHHRSEEHTSE